MDALDGRVAVVTGAGRGLGREHALLLAANGAKVVVNDVGGGPDGAGEDKSVAQIVVDEIRARGGEALASRDDVTSWDGAGALVQSAVDAFGDLHIVVNNAGILRDRMLVNMSEEEWDSVLGVHLKGTFGVTRHAGAYWRQQSKAGSEAKRALINTSSGAGLFNNLGQANYASAKAAIACLTMVAAKELRTYGVRVNAVCPVARTRLTLQTPGVDALVKAPDDDAFDEFDPANVSPLVVYLATDDCPFNGAVFHVHAGTIALFGGWTVLDRIDKDGRWSIEELDTEAKRFLSVATEKDGFLLSETGGIEQLLQPVAVR